LQITIPSIGISIINLPFNELCTTTIEVKSKSQTTNTATISFILVKNKSSHSKINLFMKIFFSAALFILSIPSYSQEFAGFRSGNYSGVNGVYFNPANIGDSRFRYDFNLFSLSTSIGNNKASFNLNDLITSFDPESLTNQLFSASGGLNSAMAVVDFRGPSLMFNTGSKMAFALTTRARTLVNIKDFDGGLGKQLMDDSESEIQLPYIISSNADMRFTVNAWKEIGLSVGRVVSDKGKHFFKAGGTFKYISGIGNGHINIQNLKGTLNEDQLGDVYLTNASGRIATGFGGIEIGELNPEDFLQFNNTAFGVDLGVVYEYRPNHEQYKSGDGYMNDRNKYKFKIGVALVDIGSIKYQKDPFRSGAYDINISNNERFYLNELSDREIDEYNEVFKSNPQYFTPSSSNDKNTYSVSLPSTLQLDFDYNIKGGIYASVAAQLPLTSGNIYSNSNYTSITLTPRYEGKGFGFYVPLNYNSLSDLNAGLSLRLGPLFIGSGSILTALMGQSKQADVHVGLHIAGLRKGK